MPPDDPRLADVRGWLRRAADDLRSAEVDLAASPPLTGDAAFHCQQATEKALKALLAWHDVPFRKTHDLAELGQQCVGLDPSLASLCQRAEPLTPFAWMFRYPGEPEEPTARISRKRSHSLETSTRPSSRASRPRRDRSRHPAVPSRARVMAGTARVTLKVAHSTTTDNRDREE
jgi:HEPN domain-containing protein